MQISAYPQCCKARVLHGFGFGHLNENDEVARLYGTTKHRRSSKEEIRRYLDEVMPRLKQEYVQVLFACPTSNQPEAIEALQEYGFFGAPEEELKNHGLTYRVNKYREDAVQVPKNIIEKQEIKHQMIPMFYLVPPNHKKVIAYN